MSTTTSYQIELSDLQKCWDFSLSYFLNPKKNIVDRTNKMTRGFGGISDAFMKKLHEIAVQKILEKNNFDICPQTDFEIHDIGKTQGDNKTEPDIIQVFRKNFSEIGYDKTKNLLEKLKKQQKSKNQSLKLLVSFRSALPKIKDCITPQHADATRNARNHWHACSEKIQNELIQLKNEEDNIENKLKIFEKQIQPKIYIEIKNTGSGDGWIGPKLSEVKSIVDRGNFKKNSIYYVYCRLVTTGIWEDEFDKKAGRRSDPLGVFLKEFIKNGKMTNFHDVSDLSIEIQNVMSALDIENHGQHFPAGTIIPNPKIFNLPGEDPIPFSHEKVQKFIDDGTFPIKNLRNNILPKETTVKIKKRDAKGNRIDMGWAPYPDALGDTTFSGTLKAYSDENGDTRRLWIKCISSVKFQNNVLGTKKFKKGEIICYNIRKKGQGDVKSVDDIWICVDNDSKMKNFPASRIAEIANKI